MRKIVTLQWKPGAGQLDVPTGALKANESVEVNFTTNDEVDGNWVFFFTQPLGNAEMTVDFRGHTQFGLLSLSFNGRGNLKANTTYTALLSVDADTPGVHCKLLAQHSRPKRGG